MNSFLTNLKKLENLLRDNADLQAFCKAKWKKGLTVKTTYRSREEVDLEDLPILMMTVPSTDKKFLAGVRDGDRTVMLYCGFPQENADKIVNEFIEFEEIIDDILLSVHPETLGFKGINPVSSDNDEGKFKPACFMAMAVQVKHRRQ